MFYKKDSFNFACDFDALFLCRHWWKNGIC